MVEDGAIFYTTSDTETIVQLIARSKKEKNIDKIIEAISQIQECLCFGYVDSKYSYWRKGYLWNTAFSDRKKIKNSYVLASETCALDIIGATFLREVENGEIVYIEDDELYSLKPFGDHKLRPCVFEYIYFSRPDKC